jgi:drug/metabolite transporter (DMT)-like permease
MSAASPRRGASLAVALVYIALWSTAFIGIKIGVRHSPPLTLGALRFLLAAAIMAGFVRWLGYPWPATARAWARLGALGALNLGLPAAFNFIALRHASAGMASMVLVSNPLILTLLAPKLLGESVTRTKVLGMVLGFGGVAYVMVARLRTSGRHDTPLGVALLVCGVLSMVGATILFKRFPPREPLLMVNVVQQLAGAALLFPAALVFEHPTQLRMSLPLLGALLHLVVVISIGTGLLWFWLLGRGEASVVSGYLFLVPILGLVFASWTLGEQFTLRDCAGLVAVTIGVLLIRQSSGPPTPKAATVPER